MITLYFPLKSIFAAIVNTGGSGTKGGETVGRGGNTGGLLFWALITELSFSSIKTNPSAESLIKPFAFKNASTN